MKKKIKYLYVSILMLMIFIMCYSRYMEPEGLVVKEIAVETDMDIENCRVVFFTDTHFGELYDEKHIERSVKMINDREADIVIFGGDLLDNYARDREILDLEYLQDELNKIEAKAGKYDVQVIVYLSEQDVESGKKDVSFGYTQDAENQYKYNIVNYPEKFMIKIEG